MESILSNFNVASHAVADNLGGFMLTARNHEVDKSIDLAAVEAQAEYPGHYCCMLYSEDDFQGET